MSDRRVLFFGDSFVSGIWDPAGGGWVGRVVAAAHAAGVPITAYNLGVRRDTTCDVAARWRAETAARTNATEASYGVVISTGANDATIEDGRRRVEPAQSVAAYAALLDGAAALGMRCFAVGPPPVGEPAQDDRIEALSAALAGVAAARSVPFVAVTAALRAAPDWTVEAAANDGAHPGAGGHAALARLVLASGWVDWLSSETP